MALGGPRASAHRCGFAAPKTQIVSLHLEPKRQAFESRRTQMPWAGQPRPPIRRRNQRSGEAWVSSGPSYVTSGGIMSQLTDAPLRGTEEIYVSSAGRRIAALFRAERSGLGGVKGSASTPPAWRSGAVRSRLIRAPLNGTWDIHLRPATRLLGPKIRLRMDAEIAGGGIRDPWGYNCPSGRPASPRRRHGAS